MATRTINPLHFEDLEPHRFEDLVRQLIYSFRDWSALEATGRQGSDDGFDARGWEVTSRPLPTSYDDEIERELDEINAEESRVWLIQCKREKAISPKKLLAHLNAINANEVSNLHGLIFVASCDFSKKSCDEFRAWCLSNGLKEFLIWGKAALEDMLFQPQNDHLLFGYFGISLQIKKRSTKTKLRSTLAMKKQIIRCLGGVGDFAHQRILVRDPDDTSYPYADEIADFDAHPLWRIYHFVGHYHAGIKLLIRTHYAFLADDHSTWDAEERVRNNVLDDDPWPPSTRKDLEQAVRKFWDAMPEHNRVTYEAIGMVPYDDILAIDESGDEHFSHPHIYVRFGRDGFQSYSQLLRNNVLVLYAAHENRTKHFPDVYPELSEKS